MTSRAVRFAVRAASATLPAILALAEPPNGEAWRAENADLCVHGHPKARISATYGGYEPMPGYQRDHIVPLCLGGTDTPANVTYQPPALAHKKDKMERAVCEHVCESGAPPAIYQAMFLDGKWVQSYTAWFGEPP